MLLFGIPGAGKNIFCAYHSMHVRHVVVGKARCWKQNILFYCLCISFYACKRCCCLEFPVLERKAAFLLFVHIGVCMQDILLLGKPGAG